MYNIQQCSLYLDASFLKSHCSNPDQYPSATAKSLILGSPFSVSLGIELHTIPVLNLLFPIFHVTYSSFVGTSSPRASLKSA